jgi:hypothetical protein
MTVPAGWETLPKSYDDKGFLITPSPALRPTGRQAQAEAQSESESQTLVPAVSMSSKKEDSAAAPRLEGASLTLLLVACSAMVFGGLLVM